MFTAAASLAPIRAFTAVRKLLRDPDDLPQVFTVIEALSGGSDVRLLERVRKTESGARLLASRSNILAILEDRDALARLPVGSLAHTYLAFLDSEKISAAGIVRASEDGSVARATSAAARPDIGWLRDRMRDTHDLWHAVTGYKGDVLGEAALLGFILAQTHSPGVGLIVAAILMKTRGDRDARRLILDGFERGRRAQFLPAIEWESLLARPIGEVRALLGVDDPPTYTPVRSADLRAASS